MLCSWNLLLLILLFHSRRLSLAPKVLGSSKTEKLEKDVGSVDQRATTAESGCSSLDERSLNHQTVKYRGCQCQHLLCIHNKELQQRPKKQPQGGLFTFSWRVLHGVESENRLFTSQIVVLLIGLAAVSLIFFACIFMIVASNQPMSHTNGSTGNSRPDRQSPSVVTTPLAGYARLSRSR